MIISDWRHSRYSGFLTIEDHQVAADLIVLSGDLLIAVTSRGIGNYTSIYNNKNADYK